MHNEPIKSCRGCKYLVAGNLCKARYDPPPIWVLNEHGPGFHPIKQQGLNILQPVTVQRAEYGPCGALGVLYERTRMDKLRRFVARFFK